VPADASAADRELPRQRPPLRQLAPAAVAIFGVTARIVVIAAILVDLSAERLPEGYVDRFWEISVASGTPYRDFEVEYPPVSLAAIELVGDPDSRATGVRLLVLAVIADAIVWAALSWRWGSRAAGAYLLAGVFVLQPLYQTLDIVPVALASVALALIWKRRDRGGGVVLAAAVLAKIWPAVLIGGLLAFGKRRALAWSVGSLAAGSILWVAWAGTGAVGQVATQRDTPGWEAGSTVGGAVWIVTGADIESIKDSPRVGTVPGWAKPALAAATVVGVGLIWLRASRARRTEEVGAASLACVALLLFLSPIYSYPYVIWLLPWLAIAFAEGRARLALMALGVVAMTAVMFALLDTTRGPVQVALVVRNALTGAIPVAYWLTAGRVRTSAAARAPAVP
jgi:hypothetical protein